MAIWRTLWPWETDILPGESTPSELGPICHLAHSASCFGLLSVFLFALWLLHHARYCTVCRVYFCSVQWDPNRLERLYLCPPVVCQAACPIFRCRLFFTAYFCFMLHVCLQQSVTRHWSHVLSLMSEVFGNIYFYAAYVCYIPKNLSLACFAFPYFFLQDWSLKSYFQ